MRPSNRPSKLPPDAVTRMCAMRRERVHPEIIANVFACSVVYVRLLTCKYGPFPLPNRIRPRKRHVIAVKPIMPPPINVVPIRVPAPYEPSTFIAPLEKRRLMAGR